MKHLNWQTLDFEHEHTGGGCTALQRYFPDNSYILVTDGDAAAPGPDTDTWCVGVYGRDADHLRTSDFTDEASAIGYAVKQIVLRQHEQWAPAMHHVRSAMDVLKAQPVPRLGKEDDDGGAAYTASYHAFIKAWDDWAVRYYG